MTDINNVISEINHYQYDIKKGVIDELAKLNTREFIEEEYKILNSLLEKGNEVSEKIKKLLGIDQKSWGNDPNYYDPDNFLRKIEHINKVSMIYDKLFLINLNCKYHVFYSGENIDVKNIMSYNNKTLDINEGNNLIILDKYNTHARIINYDNNEVNYIDIPRRNFALASDKLVLGSKYTLNDDVNDASEIKCDEDSNVSWLCNGLYHSISHITKNTKDSDNLNIVIPMININYHTFKDIKDMIKARNESCFEILNGKKVEKSNASNDCTVCIKEHNDKIKITFIGLMLFDKNNYIHSIFKDDISDDYNDVINQFIDDNNDVFNKIKNNYTKFPNFVYKMCCLNYAIKYYLNYKKTSIIDLYYATKVVFFSFFNYCFNGKLDKINELKNNNQKEVAKSILLNHYKKRKFINVDTIYQDWFNLEYLKKLGFKTDTDTGTSTIKIPSLASEQDKLKKFIHNNLREIRNEIKRLHTAHNDFETMINEIIENGSISQNTQLNNNTIKEIKQVIEKNTGKLVCIPVFCMNRHTSYRNYKLMERVIKKIKEKIKEKAGVKKETSSN